MTRRLYQFVFIVIFLGVYDLSYSGEYECGLTIDLVENVDGGVEQGGKQLANLDLTYLVNTEEFGWSDKGQFFVYFLGNMGGDPTDIVGDAQGTSNIETNNTAKLYELWYQHQFSDSFAVTMGLHDYNSVFYVLDTAGAFINSSFGIGIEVAQVGPSIFSTTSLGAIAQFNTNHWYLLATLYDGIPGNPNNDDGTHIRFDSEDGVFSGVELGWSDNGKKLGVGSWYHNAIVENPVDNSRMDSNYGVYIIGETPLHQSYSGFFQAGFAQSSKNTVDQYLGLGLTKTGILAAEDTLGIGVATAFLSSDYRNQNRENEKYETAIELTYQVNATKWLTIHPDLQYIVNPGFDPGIDNAFVFTLRLEAIIPN
ncbi:carbohydrate porin [Teredinibacter sp. KSP-S5-2]|uniref:carbohydrate porin n=1 Tax=Teredinibacter sp. KSP-S5-2 TaxID=3034506 RepID=UPI00293487A2|nr:carbohydrate porin [Teredinibacter sp. KSP-S5-2]WNO08255.1 carbohydrate porin [Teredinibacter sp. KSP-S5-2]